MNDEDPKTDGPGPAAPESPVSLPASEVEELRAAAAKAAEYLDLAKRTKADFINYQTRARREREEFQKFAVESLLREILPVADDLQRLLAAPSDSGATALVDGVRILERELSRVFGKWGIRPIETAGKKFDPAFHDAAESAPPPEGASDGDILAEVRRGYLLNDRVLRPAAVRVARAAP